MLNYAALDAYASLLIYQKLVQISVPSSLPDQLTALSEIILYDNADCSRTIAKGHISDQFNQPSFDGINVTKTRTLVAITEVTVPGAIVSTHHKRSLRSFGGPPFSIVCLRSHLRLSNGVSNNLPPDLPPTSSLCLDPKVANQSSHAGSVSSASEPSSIGSDDPPTNIGVEAIQQFEEMSLSDIILDQVDLSEQCTGPPVNLAAHDRDPQSEAECEAMLGSLPEPASNQHWTTVRSRVITDPFHLFHRFYISTTHGLRISFARALRDALFVPDKEDKQCISAWAASQKPPMTFDELVRKRPAWVWKRCKRVIPPPEELDPIISAVFHLYGSLKDAKTGAPVFNSAAWNVARNISILIHDGHVSDVPGVPLYTIIGVDAENGLPIYRCARGTTFTEGGVHTHLRPRLPSSGVSPEHINTCLSDFILRHNLLVCFCLSLTNKNVC
jgi:hypothetical protein